MTFDIAGTKASVVNPESVVRTAAEWASARGAEVCLLDARSVFGREHLESAALHAIRARDARTMSSRSVAMETLLARSASARIRQPSAWSSSVRRGSTTSSATWDGPATTESSTRKESPSKTLVSPIRRPGPSPRAKGPTSSSRRSHCSMCRSDAAARIRTWEPLQDETLNLAPFPCLATAANSGKPPSGRKRFPTTECRGHGGTPNSVIQSYICGHTIQRHR